MEELLKSVEDTIEKYIDIISQKYNIPKDELIDIWKGSLKYKVSKKSLTNRNEKSNLTSSKNELGQYFTTNIQLKQKVFDFILNKPEIILEPSIGQGDLIIFIQEREPKILFDMYEIDTKIKLINGVNKSSVIYGDFILQKISKKYKTIIGNPPYVRTKKGNLYIDFIEKCYNILENSGEMIFIVPSDFFKLTCASKLLNNMMIGGTFTHIFHPNNENMFENASIDVIVFRYCKDALIEKKTIYNDKLLYAINNNGMITFSEKEFKHNNIFKDYFDIYVGLVSGKEDIYKNEELGNIKLLNGENKFERYIYIEKYPCENQKINQYLLQYKNQLIKRKIRKFNEFNWFEWGAPRNINTITKNLGKDCIYIHNLTRKSEVSFMGKVNYFGGNLLLLIPKLECDLQNIVSYINSDIFKENFMFSGRFKIGHRQIYNSYIPNEYL
jgi:adenine-specific DNA-methyltransferase